MKALGNLFALVAIYYLIGVIRYGRMDSLLLFTIMINAALVLSIGMIEERPSPLWFRTKSYGYGWVPVRWQGWAAVIGYCALTIADVYVIDRNAQSVSEEIITMLPFIALNMASLLAICLRTGDKPRWR